MRGIDTLLLITPSVPAQGIAVIDAAARRAVKHVVKITKHKATEDSPVERRRDHARIEAPLRATGLTYTLLRPTCLCGACFSWPQRSSRSTSW
ncbi:hypothetical protein [Streptomyces sp. NRRL F-5630]|uniref:hypothetical protein n=1 Tax=Streptomyces sp. NRRL F-5630 TaxID=1463864 RepID=UPI003EBFFCA6